MAAMTQLFYDKDNDVLYLSIGAPRPAISREVGDDIVLRIDPDTSEITGLTVLNLSARFGSLQDQQTLPIEINLRELSE